MRVYFPDYEGIMRGDVPVVLLTELADNLGMSVTNAAQVLVVEVLATQRLLPPVVVIEHYEEGSGGTPQDPHTFDLLTFSCLRLREDVPELPGLHYEIGVPSWQPLDRASVEALLGGPVDRRPWRGGLEGRTRRQGPVNDGRPEDKPRGAPNMDDMDEQDQDARRLEQDGRRYWTQLRLTINGEPDRLFDLFAVPVSITRFDYVGARAIGPFSANVPDSGIEETEEGDYRWWYGNTQGFEASFGAASSFIPWLRDAPDCYEERVYVREAGEEEWRPVPAIDVGARPGEPAVDVGCVGRVVDAYPKVTDRGRLQDLLVATMLHPIRNRLRERYIEYFEIHEGRGLTEDERREVLEYADKRTIEVLCDEMEPAWEEYWAGHGDAGAGSNAG